MKKWMALLMASLVLSAAALTGCSQGGSSSSQSSVSSGTESSAAEKSAVSDSSEKDSSAEQESVSSAVSESSETQSSVESGSSETDPAIEAVVEKYDFEGVIYAVKGGKVVASYADGTLATGEDITLDTFMPLGSTSKQFCAVSILMLMEKGKLSLDDTLDKYFPTYESGKKMTIQNVLAMRAGLPNTGMDLMEVLSDDKSREENCAAYEEWLFAQPVSEPDTNWAYSNCGYYLLAKIVEQVSGKSYHQYLRDEIFTPLGMNHTGAIEELSASPEWAGGIRIRLADDDWGITLGAGDLVSSGPDMAVWMDAIRKGTIISQESYQLMTTDYSPSMHYGFALFLELVNGGVGHGGTITSEHLPGAGNVNYSAYDYIDDTNDLTLFYTSDSIDISKSTAVLTELVEAVNGVSE